MSDFKNILDTLLRIQGKILSYPSAKRAYKKGEGNVSLLKVVGPGEQEFLLKAQNGRIQYAEGWENPKHILLTSQDTFLNIFKGLETVREAISKGHFAIKDAETKEIDLVEEENWSKAFSNLRDTIRKVVPFG